MTAAQLETLSNQFPDLRQLVGEIIKYLNDNPGGGGGLTIYTGDGTLAGDRIVDLAEHFLGFQQGGNDLFIINPQGFEAVLRGTDGTANTTFEFRGDLVGNSVLFKLNADDGTNEVEIIGNAIAKTLEYTADTHKLNGISEFADNAAALGGGLEAGMLYYTDVAGDGILKIVI